MNKRMNKRTTMAGGVPCISRMYAMIFMKIYNSAYALLSLLNDYRYQIYHDCMMKYYSNNHGKLLGFFDVNKCLSCRNMSFSFPAGAAFEFM